MSTRNNLIPLNSTPVSEASLTGLVRPNDNVEIISNTQPISSANLTPRRLASQRTSSIPAPASPIISIPSSPTRRQKLAPPTVLPSAPVSSFSFRAPEKERTVEEDLLKSGFLPLENILTRDSSGNVAVRYIKASTRQGKTVFVELDTNGYVAVKPDDLTLIESNPSSSSSYSSKVGRYQCIGNGICGVAFECNLGICTLTRDNNTLATREQNFIVTEKPSVKVGVLDDESTAHPIVKLSEIMANPKLVNTYVNTAVTNIRKADGAECNVKQKKLNDDAALLNEEIKKYNNKINAISKQLPESISTLENFEQSYVSKSLNGAELSKYNSVVLNLQERQRLTNELYRICYRVGALSDTINNVTQQIKSVNDYLDKHYQYINYNLFPTTSINNL